MQQPNREDRIFLCCVLWVVGVLLFLPKKNISGVLEDRYHSGVTPQKLCHTAIATNERSSSVDGPAKRKHPFAKKLMKTIAARCLEVNIYPLIVYINISYIYTSDIVYHISYITYHIIIYQYLSTFENCRRATVVEMNKLFLLLPYRRPTPPPVLLSGLVESACWAWWIWWNCVGWVSEHLPGH